MLTIQSLNATHLDSISEDSAAKQAVHSPPPQDAGGLTRLQAKSLWQLEALLFSQSLSLSLLLFKGSRAAQGAVVIGGSSPGLLCHSGLPEGVLCPTPKETFSTLFREPLSVYEIIKAMNIEVHVSLQIDVFIVFG